MTVLSDGELQESMAEMLYNRSVAGFGRDWAPPWLGCPEEVRNHWRDISRAALNMVRVADGAQG
jgi:hypothetical protein